MRCHAWSTAPLLAAGAALAVARAGDQVLLSGAVPVVVGFTLALCVMSATKARLARVADGAWALASGDEPESSVLDGSLQRRRLAGG